MSPPIHLKEHFDRGSRYLVAVGFQVFMATEHAEFYPVRRRRLPAIMVDLPQLWERFGELAGEKIEFTKPDIAKVAGVSPRMIRRWQRVGWLPEGVGAPTSPDAFAAGLVGALVRAGANEICISKASHFVRIGEPSRVRR